MLLFFFLYNQKNIYYHVLYSYHFNKLGILYKH
uniref:Uncharacterized protein n=1 Tax=Anguilla anguilla TaxID=7936 RepID=A0A0E9QQY6_ANGAN